MMNLTLKQLRYFQAITQHGHFGRAAEASGISQPALSMQIRELEESLGTPLLERGARHVRLTAFGATFAARTSDILRAVDELGDLARAAQKHDMGGQLRLGIIPTIAPYLLPGIIASVGRLYPGLDLNIRETVTSRLVEELHDGKLDAAILALPVSEPWLCETILLSEAFLLVRPEDQAGLPVPDRAALREMRLLLLEEGHCFRDQALSFCAMASGAPREWLNGSSLTTLVQMVAAGIGVTLIPEMAVAVETRATAVSVDRFSGDQPMRLVGMVWRRTNPLAGRLSAFAEIIRDAVTPASKAGKP